jgi:activator of HSP90 ATPase
MSNALAKINLAVKALTEAKDLQSVKDVRDKAVALKAYASQKTGAEETILIAQELITRAERKMGEFLDVTIKQGGKRVKLPDEEVGNTLATMGISYNQSSKYQKLAEIPDKQFEEILEIRKGMGERITTTAIVNEYEQPTIMEQVSLNHRKVLRHCMSTIASSSRALEVLIKYKDDLSYEDKKDVASAIQDFMILYKQLSGNN